MSDGWSHNGIPIPREKNMPRMRKRNEGWWYSVEYSQYLIRDACCCISLFRIEFSLAENFFCESEDKMIVRFSSCDVLSYIPANIWTSYNDFPEDFSRHVFLLFNFKTRQPFEGRSPFALCSLLFAIGVTALGESDKSALPNRMAGSGRHTIEVAKKSALFRMVCQGLAPDSGSSSRLPHAKN